MPFLKPTVANRSAPSSEELVGRHLSLVHFVARQLQRKLVDTIEMDDLIDAGTVGLIEAVDNFDATRGLAFSTFATPRIRGAMLDDLRKWDNVPRTLRKRQRDLNRTEMQLEARLHRAPTMQEVAVAFDVDAETVCRWRAESNETRQVSIDVPVQPGGEADIRLADLLSAGPGTEIEDALTFEEEVDYLKSELARLTEREQMVLALYYFEGLKLHEIAEVLELTESRISQIRTKALATLRGSMKHLRAG